MPELDLGSVVGPQGKQGEIGPPGEQGVQGDPGPAATINGVNALTLTAGDNITLKQDGGTLEIGAVVPGKILNKNWDFRRPVNRNGRVEYTGNGYGIDLWKGESASSIVRVKDNCIWISHSATTWAVAIIAQNFDGLSVRAGQSVTFSLLYRNLTVTDNATLSLQLYSTVGTVYSASTTQPEGVLSLTFTPKTDANINAIRVIKITDTGIIALDAVAAILEPGDHQTHFRQNDDGEWEVIDQSDYDLQYLLCSQYSPSTGEWVGLQHSNDNLLINSYWDNKEAVINQRMAERYSTAGYGIDGWYIESGAAIEIQDDGIVFTPDSSKYCAGYQRVENWQSLIGKQLTLSVLIAENTCSNCLLWFYGGTSDNFASAVLGDDKLYSVTMTLNENAKSLRCGVQGRNSTGSVKIRGFKLEPGPVQTLAHKEGDTWVLNDPPPNKALELLKCQRYVYRPSYNFSYFVRASKIMTNALYFEIHLPVAMRCSPTFDKSALAITPFVGGAAIAGFTFDSTMASNGYGSVLRINATKANHGLTDAVIDLVTILFDANL